MNLKWLFVFNAVVVAVSAVPAVLAPGLLFSFYGIGSSSAAAQFTMQLFGSALAAEAVITWGLRDIAPGSTRQVLTLALFIEAALALVASLIAQLGGLMNAFGWGVVALPAIFTVGYGYYRFVRPDAK